MRANPGRIGDAEPSHAAPPQWPHARRLLCVRLDSLGDVLMTTPAIRALREAVPDRQISLLTSPAGAAVARLVPEIDEVLVYEAPWMKATPPRRDSAADEATIGLLRSQRFDAAVIFTVFSQNPLPAAFLCTLADIPLRLAHCRENPYQLLTDWVPEREPEAGIRHEVRRQLDLVRVVGADTANERLSLAVPAAARDRVAGFVAAAGIDPCRPWVLLHPGASAPSRRYPPEHFADVTRALVREHRLPVLFSGGAGERELVDGIRSLAGVPAASLAGRLDLAELAALIQMAPVLVANNSGPAHIAAALGTAVVDCYALTNPQHTPWQVASRVLSHDVPCKYCYKSVCPELHHACLRGVAPHEVVGAALALLQLGTPASRRPVMSLAEPARTPAPPELTGRV